MAPKTSQAEGHKLYTISESKDLILLGPEVKWRVALDEQGEILYDETVNEPILEQYETGEIVPVYTLEYTTFADPTFDTAGRIYNVVKGVLGGDPLEPVKEFLGALGMDPDKITRSLKGASDAAQRAQRAREILEYQAVVNAYNAEHQKDLKALGKKRGSLESQLAQVNDDIKGHQDTLAGSIKGVESLNITFLGDQGEFYIDSDTLKESQKGTGKRGGGSRIKRDWSAGSWSVVKPNTLKGVEGPVTCTASVKGVDPATGKGAWEVTFVPKSGKVYKSPPGNNTLNAAAKSALTTMIASETGKDPGSPTWNAPHEFDIPPQGGQAVVNAA